MNRKIVGVGIGALIAGIIFGVFMAQTRFGQMTGSFTMNRSVDRHFIEQMIPHHEGAVDMSRVALDRSKHPEVLALANGIIEAQTLEINKMSEWYRNWFGTQVPVASGDSMGGGMIYMGNMSGDLGVLEVTTDFDREFLRQMIPHHEMAVMMARMLGVATDRAEMKEFASQIVVSQSQEIELMRDLLKSL